MANRTVASIQAASRSSARVAAIALGMFGILAAAEPVSAQLATSRAPVAGLPNGLESPPTPPPAAPGGCSERRRADGLAEPSLLQPSSGEFHLAATDLRCAARGFDFVWTRTYRSRFGPSTAQGHGWDFAYNAWIEVLGSDVVVHDGGGRVDRYALRANGKYAAVEFFREGEFLLNGSFKLVFADSGAWHFNALGASPSAGKLASIVDRNGSTLQLSYDAQGRLTTILDTLLRPITIAYDAGGRISTVSDFAGRQVKYTYYQAGDAGGAPGDLASATGPAVVGTPTGNDFPQGKTTTYTYSMGFADDRLNHNLLTIRDPKGQTWLQNTYAASAAPADLAFDRVVEQRRGNAADTLELTYVSLLPKPFGDATPEVLRCIVNDRVGNVSELFYDARGRCVAQREFTGRAPDPGAHTTATANRPVGPLRPDDPAYFETRWTYNADSLVTLTVHPNLNQTRRIYELELNANAPWRTRGNLRELRRLPGGHTPVGDQAELVDFHEHLAGFGSCCGASFVTKHTDPRGFDTTQGFDANGNPLARTLPAGQLENWEYNAFGQVTAHVLPDNGSGWRRRDEYAYYSSGAQKGYLQSLVVDAALGGFQLTTTHTYDAVGNVVRTVDPRGNDVLYTYNALDQLIREQSKLAGGYDGIPLHRYRRDTHYDANDKVVRVDVRNIDELGATSGPNPDLTTLYEHDVLNRLTRATREVAIGQDVVVEYQYDPNGNRTLTRHGMATSGAQPTNVLRELYDERDRLWRSIRAEGDALQSTTQLDWDGNGNPKAERRGLESSPRVTAYTYDAYDRKLSAIDPMGNVTEYHYDGGGDLGGDQSPMVPNPFGVRVTGELVDVPGNAGNVRLCEETYAYDASGRRIETIVQHFDPATQSPIGDGEARTQTTWTGSSEVQTTIDDNGHTTTSTYDTAGRLLLVTDAKGNTTTFTYDANSDAISVVELERSDLGQPNQTLTTAYQYDALDRLTRTTDGLGQTHKRYYDSRDNPRLVIDKRGNRTRYAYDGLDRLVTTTEELTDTGSGGGTVIDLVVTQQVWDASSRLTTRTDDDAHPTGYAYDALDRLIAVDRPDCTDESITYDVHDCEVSRVDANQTQVDTQFDLLRRPTTRSVSYSNPYVIGTTAESYQYDGLSRIVRAQDDDSLVTRKYDSLSNLIVETQRVLPSGPIRTIASTFDGVGNRTQATYPGGRVIGYTYDALGRLSVINDATGTIGVYQYLGKERVERRDQGNGTRTDYAYDAVSRLVRTTDIHVGSATLIDDRLYSRDGELNKLQDDQLAPPYESRAYTYDSRDRLIQSSSMLWACGTDYVLSSTGDRLLTTGCPGTGSYGASGVTCVPADQQMHQYTTTPMDERTYDDNGNLVGQTDPDRAYRYDYRNRLCRFENLLQNKIATYRYDCFDRRIERTVGGVLRRHYYLGDSEIEEQSSLGAVLATYVWGGCIGRPANQLIQMVRGSKYYMHHDDEGSIVRITDASGALAESLMYRDFGDPLQSAIDQQPDRRYVYDSHRTYSSGSGYQSLFMAEEFAFGQDTTVSAIRWWGGYDYAPPPVPSYDQFVIEIYDDAGAGGVPGNLVYQEYAYNATRTATGQQAGGAIGLVDEFRYDCVLQSPYIGTAPFHAQTGRKYWLVITNDTSGYPHTWGWETSSDPPGGCIGYSIEWQPWQEDCSTGLAFKLTSSPPTVTCPYGYMGRRFDPESWVNWTPTGCIDPRAGVFLDVVVPGMWLFPGCVLQDSEPSWLKDMILGAIKDWLKEIQKALEEATKTGGAAIKFEVTKVTIESLDKIAFEVKLADGTIVSGVIENRKTVTFAHKELQAAFLKVQATPGWAKLLKAIGWCFDIYDGYKRVTEACDLKTAIEILELYLEIVKADTEAEWMARIRFFNDKFWRLVGGDFGAGVAAMGAGWIGADGTPPPKDERLKIIEAIRRVLNRLYAEREKREKEKKAQKK